MQGIWVQSLVGELRSHMPCGQKSQHIKQKHDGNRFNKDFKNGSHQKILKKKSISSLESGLCTHHLLLLFSQQVMSDSLWPPGLLHTIHCPLSSPGVCPSSCPLNRWCHPTIPSSVGLFSFCLQNPSQHQGLFPWVSFSHQVAKVLELQLQHQSFQWVFRTDFL